MRNIILKLTLFLARLIGRNALKKPFPLNSKSNINTMRKINEIIVHCSATRADQNVSAADIDLWHKQKGYDCIGYHFFIKRDGTIETGRPIAKVGAHCKGLNNNSIGICYAGGTTRMGDQLYYVDNRTPEQIRSLYLLITTLLHCYPGIKKISGHRQYANKACPCFDAEAEYKTLLDAVRAVDWYAK